MSSGARDIDSILSRDQARWKCKWAMSYPIKYASAVVDNNRALSGRSTRGNHRGVSSSQDLTWAACEKAVPNSRAEGVSEQASTRVKFSTCPHERITEEVDWRWKLRDQAAMLEWGSSCWTDSCREQGRGKFAIFEQMLRRGYAGRKLHIHGEDARQTKQLTEKVVVTSKEGPIVNIEQQIGLRQGTSANDGQPTDVMLNIRLKVHLNPTLSVRKRTSKVAMILHLSARSGVHGRCGHRSTRVDARTLISVAVSTRNLWPDIQSWIKNRCLGFWPVEETATFDRTVPFPRSGEYFGTFVRISRNTV